MNRRDARVVAIVQARMSSRRLPGKVLTEIGGRPALLWVLMRLGGAGELHGIVLATSTGSDDDPVAELGHRVGVSVHRGPLDDVLERFAGAVREVGADAIVRVTGDCPLVEPALLDCLVGLWREGEADYVSNVIEPRTFPKGLDLEVISAAAIAAASAEATEAGDREHVTSFVRARPERFPAQGLWMEPDMSEQRITLDTANDLSVLRALADRLGPEPGIEAILPALGGPAVPTLSLSPPAAGGEAR
jgi:spore coat polysaccharide biosynthesis protein SpsF